MHGLLYAVTTATVRAPHVVRVDHVSAERYAFFEDRTQHPDSRQRGVAKITNYLLRTRIRVQYLYVQTIRIRRVPSTKQSRSSSGNGYGLLYSSVVRRMYPTHEELSI